MQNPPNEFRPVVTERQFTWLVQHHNIPVSINVEGTKADPINDDAELV